MSAGNERSCSYSPVIEIVINNAKKIIIFKVSRYVAAQKNAKYMTLGCFMDMFYSNTKL